MGGGEYRGFLNPRTLNIVDRYGRGRNARGEGLRVPVTARLRGLGPGEHQTILLPNHLRKAAGARCAGARDHSQGLHGTCLLYTSPSPRDATLSRMPSSA